MSVARVVLLSCLLGVGALTTPPPGRADTLLREVRGWRIVVSDEYRGCVALARYRNETVLRFGLDGISGTPFINFSNPLWRGFTAGSHYDVEFRTDLQQIFSGLFRAVQRDGLPTLEYGDLNAAFIEAFSGASTMTMAVEGRRLAEFDLSGTRAAVAEVMRCGEAMR